MLKSIILFACYISTFSLLTFPSHASYFDHGESHRTKRRKLDIENNNQIDVKKQATIKRVLHAREFLTTDSFFKTEVFTYHEYDDEIDLVGTVLSMPANTLANIIAGNFLFIENYKQEILPPNPNNYLDYAVIIVGTKDENLRHDLIRKLGGRYFIKMMLHKTSI